MCPAFEGAARYPQASSQARSPFRRRSDRGPPRGRIREPPADRSCLRGLGNTSRNPEPPCCNKTLRGKLGIELRVSRRQTLAAVCDEFRLTSSHHRREETKPLEYGLISELVRVTNKEFRVAIRGLEIRL